ncbi:MAG: hypothetical protein ACXWQQ_11315 [Pseudobdellovibrio sp.]
MFKLFLLSVTSLFLSACNTLFEHADFTSYQTNQHQYINNKGEQVTHYTEVHQSSDWITPPPAPDKVFLAGVDPHSSDLSYSNPVPPTHNKTSQEHFFLEMSGSGKDLHLGFHLGFPLSDKLMLRGGASVVISDDPYYGLDFSGRYRFRDSDLPWSPFAGLGIFYGDSRTCTPTSATTEECDKKFLGLGYAEAGIKYEHLDLFYRSYSINRAGISIPARDFIGIGVEF